MRILLSFVILFIACSSQAQPDERFSLPALFPEAFTDKSTDLDVLFARWRDRIKLGRELELTEKPLTHMMSLLDFSGVSLTELAKGMKEAELKQFAKEYLNDYPMNQEAFEALPEIVRKHLTEGLNLQNLIVHESQSMTTAGPRRILLPEGVSGDRAIVDPTGKPAQRGLILGESKFILSEDNKVDPKIVESLDKLTHWRVFANRWSRMDPQELIALVRPEFLEARLKAKLLLNYGRYEHVQYHVRFDSKIQGNILENMEWVRALSAIEFREKETSVFTDAAEFIRQLYLFARKAGIEREIHSPIKVKEFSSSFHFHLSVPDLPENQSFEKRAEYLNVLILLRHLNLGIWDVISEISTQRHGTYVREVQLRGLLRLISRNRIEFRTHLDDPTTSLRFLLYILALPENEAIQLLESRISELSTPKILDMLMKYESTRPAARKILLSRKEMTLEQAKDIFNNGSRTDLADLMNKFPQRVGELVGTPAFRWDILFYYTGRVTSGELLARIFLKFERAPFGNFYSFVLFGKKTLASLDGVAIKEFLNRVRNAPLASRLPAIALLRAIKLSDSMGITTIETLAIQELLNRPADIETILNGLLKTGIYEFYLALLSQVSLRHANLRDWSHRKMVDLLLLRELTDTSTREVFSELQKAALAGEVSGRTVHLIREKLFDYR